MQKKRLVKTSLRPIFIGIGDNKEIKININLEVLAKILNFAKNFCYISVIFT